MITIMPFLYAIPGEELRPLKNRIVSQTASGLETVRSGSFHETAAESLRIRKKERTPTELDCCYRSHSARAIGMYVLSEISSCCESRYPLAVRLKHSR